VHSRGQSEVVGSILLVAVIIVAVSTVGAVAFAVLLDEDDPVSTVVGVEGMNESTITLQHGGGDPVAVAGLEVVARNSTSDPKRYSFANGTELMSDGDDRFETGERWKTNHSFPECDRVQLLLIDRSTETVLLDSAQWAGSDQECRTQAVSP
jgi:flagellin-like protein